MSAKWGIFGHSFNDFIEASNKRKIVIDDLFTINGVSLQDAKKQAGSFWSYLYPKKEDIKSQLIDVEALYPKIDKDNFDFDGWIDQLNGIDKEVKAGTKSWQDYSASLNDNQKWIAKWGQETEGQIRTEKDLVQANQKARESAIAHNEELKNLTLGAKAAKVATKALAMAGNMLLSWGISKGIELIVKGIDNLVHSAEHCKERVDELMSSYQSALDKANSNAATVEDLASRYEELSKGVNNLGQNMSLTTDEYSEYNDIANQIADMFPALIQGYTDEGTAILSLKGNVEQLRDAYEDARQEAYNMLVGSDGNDIISSWKNTNEVGFSSDLFDFGSADIGSGKVSLQKLADQFKALSEMSVDTYRNIIEATSYGNHAAIDSLSGIENDIGYGSFVYKALGLDGDITDEAFEEARKRARAIAQSYQAEIDSALNNVRALANAYLMTNEDYAQLDESAKNVASIIVNSLNEEIANGFEDKADIGAYVEGIVEIIHDNDHIKQAMIDFFTPKLDDETVNDFIARVTSAIQTIQTYCNENGITVPIKIGGSTGSTLGILNVFESIFQRKYEDAVSRFGDAEKALLEDFFKEHSINDSDEIDYWNTITEDAQTAEEAIRMYMKAKLASSDGADALSISQTVDQINNQLKPSLDALANAYQAVFSFHDETGEKLFSLQDIGIETYASIKSSLDELNKIDGVNIDYSVFDRFVSVLSDTSSTADEVQEQFDNLATSMIYATDCTNMSAETYDILVKSLTEMGVTNADEVLSNLRDIQEKLVALGYDVADITAKEASELIKFGLVSAETAEYLQMYLVQKELAQNPLSTLDDITKLEDLCNALGVTGQLYEYVIDLKRAFDAKERGVVSAGLDESIEHIKGKIAELAEGHGDFRFNFSSTDADKPSGSGYAASSAKDTAETFDWIARAIENVEAEIDKLDHIAGSAYSSFSEKNQALADQIGKVKEEIQLQQQAYNNYMDKANSVSLPDAYQQLVQSGAVNIEDITDEALREAIRNYQEWYEAAQNTQDKINDLYEKSNDLHVSSYENCADELEQLRDSQTISEREYLDRMTALWEFYYKDQTALANQAKEARLELLHEEKDYLQSVADAASDILDRRSDALEDSRDAIIDGYNAQIDALEAQKKPLQDQLDMMEKAEAHEDRILALQKAQAAFRRAESQRDKLKYVNGQMVYTTDEKAVRDAKEALDDAEFEIAKANIQDRIDAYDMQIEKLNELIDATNQYYDNELRRIEQLKNGWQEAQALEQSAIGRVHFESMFGEGSISQLLSGDLSMVNTWKQTYLDTLAGIDMISNGADGDITAKYAELAGLDLTNVTEQTKTVASQFDALNQAVDSVNSAIGAAGGGEPAETEKTDTADKQTETPDSLIGAMEASYDTALQVIPAQVEMMNSFTAATQGAVSVVNELIASLERLNAMSMNAPAPVHTESGKTAYNGGETEKLLTALNNPPALTNSLAADKTWQRHMQQQTSPDWYQDRVSSINGKDYYVSEKYVGRISNAASSVTNNTPSYVLNGGVNVTCAGITSQEVAKQVGAEIEKTFFGINSKAYQKANITR